MSWYEPFSCMDRNGPQAPGNSKLSQPAPMTGVQRLYAMPPSVHPEVLPGTQGNASVKPPADVVHRRKLKPGDQPNTSKAVADGHEIASSSSAANNQCADKNVWDVITSFRHTTKCIATGSPLVERIPRTWYRQRTDRWVVFKTKLSLFFDTLIL